MLLERLISETGLKKSSLLSYANSASKRYFVFQIDKRNGSKRTIEHPARPIKALQRWLNYRLLGPFEVHQCATAYKMGSSIRDNASRHLHSLYTTRIDLEEFFPSFDIDGIHNFLKESSRKFHHFDESDLDIVCKILTRNGRLTIGAPSSPILTNVMMFDFDSQMYDFCRDKNIIYTRYADDLFFSSHKADTLRGVEDAARDFLIKFPFAKLNINNKKTKYLNKKNHRSITGLVLTSDHKISIGRGRKRVIKSMIFKFTKDILDLDEISRLQGLLAFCYDVEPLFIERLESKYGPNVIQNLLGRRVAKLGMS